MYVNICSVFFVWGMYVNIVSVCVVCGVCMYIYLVFFCVRYVCKYFLCFFVWCMYVNIFVFVGYVCKYI